MWCVKMSRLNIVAVFLIFVLIICCAEGFKHKAKKPHIVVIIGDDIGWNDFGFHGSSQIPTPNIDALGYNGVFLNKFYTQAICSPSRAAFLTGKYPMRIGYQGTPLSSGEHKPIPKDTELLPEKLKQLGYKTHLVGKWHLSAARKEDTPTRRGFDTHFGYWNGFVGYFDYFAYQSMQADWNMNTTWSGLDLHDFFKPQWQYQGQYATEVFTDKSLEIIEKHDKNTPLFLYLGHLAAHTGANGTELGVPDIEETERKYSYIEEPTRRRYADVVNQLDKSVGSVVKKLKEKDMLDNSIILFLSDNGAQTRGIYENYGSNYPLKGLKFTLLEGGVRGSAVLYSPLLAKKGYINNHLMHITDMFSTFVHVAGGHHGENLDGINQWKSISENCSSSREELLINIDEKNGYSGLLTHSGQYKFLNGSFQKGIYDGAQGDTGRGSNTPAYDITSIIHSDVNEAIQSLRKSRPVTPEKIMNLRNELDISSCNGKTRTTDEPCLGECLFDLWDDPCETENIIEKQPLVADYLRERLGQYFEQIVPARNAKIDLNSNPQYCNNTWFNWLDEDGCPSANLIVKTVSV